jgi:hypothetical protein
MDPGNITTGRSFFGDDLPPLGSVIDDTWIVQHKHGPFKREEAPTAPGTCEPHTCKTLDHWGERFTGALRAAAQAARRANHAAAHDRGGGDSSSSSSRPMSKLGVGAGTAQVGDGVGWSFSCPRNATGGACCLRDAIESIWPQSEPYRSSATLRHTHPAH